jgi:hypothetical protein
MGPKCNASDSHSDKAKKVRRPLRVAEKLDIMEQTECDERNRDISIAMNLSSSTVSTILSQKEKLNEVAESSVVRAQFECIT